MEDNKEMIEFKENQKIEFDKIELGNEDLNIKIEDLKNSQKYLECILNEFQKKVESYPKEKNLVLNHNEISFKNESFKSLITPINSLDEIKQSEKYEIIIDLISFYTFEKNTNQNKKEILSKLFNNYLSEKGELLLLCDFRYLNELGKDLNQILGEENKFKMLMKLYIVSKIPFLALFTLKKIFLTKEKSDILNEKILAYEIYEEDLTLTKPISYTLAQMPKTVAYMRKMFLYQKYLAVLHPGKCFNIEIKVLFWSEDLDFSMMICDSDNEEIINKKNCSSVIIGQSYLHNFINLNKIGILALSKQCLSSRLIVIRPSPFNGYTIDKVKERLSSYIMLFKFNECQQKSFPIMMLSDDSENVDKVYIDNKLLIREVKRNDTILRQLIYLESPHEIQAEIKILLTSKSKLGKNIDNKYIPINTIERYKSKKIIEAFDDSYLSMFYTQASLISIFFLNFEDFPKNSKKILILGAGVGNICYFFDKILSNNVEIDAVETDKKITELGRDYFGLNNYKKEKGKKDNIKGHFMDAHTFIEKEKEENYYDLIIMNIHNTNSKQERSPPNLYFEDKIISKINKMLKEEGIYIMYLMCKNLACYKDSFNSIEKNFKTNLFVNTYDDLNKICYCFKSKGEKDELIKKYEKNYKELLSKDKEIVDLKIIETPSVRLMKKIVELKKN